MYIYKIFIIRVYTLSIINVIYKYIVYIKNNLIEYKKIKLKRYYQYIKKI